MSYVNYIDQTKIPGIVSSVQPLYAPLSAIEQGLAVASADSSSISLAQTWYAAALDDPNYILNLKAYDLQETPFTSTDSYYITAYDNEGAFVDAAYGYSDLTQSFNAVENYINPFDPAVLQFVQELYDKGLIAYDIPADKQIVQLYNYIIKNFNYVAEAKDDWNFASETIFAKGGDCEDLAILLASAGMTVLLNAGMSYAEALAKFSVVAGTHQQYGDHVFVQYLAADNETYVLDPALAREGAVANINDFQRLSELKDFTVYFRFNDQQIIGGRSPIERPGAQYIDPGLPEVLRYAELLAGTLGLNGQETLDQLFIQVVNYLRTHAVCPVGRPGCDIHNVVELGIGGSESLSVLAVDVFLALAQKQGYALTDIQARIGVVQLKKEGRTEVAVSYSDEQGMERLVDFTDSLIDIHQQLKQIGSVDDFYTITSFVAAQDLVGLKRGRIITAAAQPQRREVTRFNAQAGTALVDTTLHTDIYKLTETDLGVIKQALEDSSSRSLSGIAPEREEALAILRQQRDPRLGNATDLDINESDHWTVNQNKITKSLISQMANISNWMSVQNDMWSFNEREYELLKNKLQTQRSFLAVIAMIQEANMQSYALVTEALEAPGASDGYRSMRASQLIQAENEFINKGIAEIKNEAAGTVQTHNKLIDQIKTKDLEEKQRIIDEDAVTAGVISTAVVLVATLIGATLLDIAITSLTSGPVVAATFGLSLIAAAALWIVKTIMSKSATLPTATIQLVQNVSQANTASRKAEEIKDPAYASASNSLLGFMRAMGAVSQEATYADATDHFAENKPYLSTITDNMAAQYGQLRLASTISYKPSARGKLWYEDDRSFFENRTVFKPATKL